MVLVMHGWSDGWIGLVWMVLIWGAILAVVYALVRAAAGSSSRSQPSSPSALEVLDARFARGEISTEEYAERRHVLQASSK